MGRGERTEIFLESTLLNGVTGSIAEQLTCKPSEKMYRTPFLQELIGIVLGHQLLQGTDYTCEAYTDCKSALIRVQNAFNGDVASTLHLFYGSILSAIKIRSINNNYAVKWTQSHPERIKDSQTWSREDTGIQRAHIITSNDIGKLRKL